MLGDFFSAIRLLLALTCEESSRLLSQQFDEPLSSTELWAVRLHQVSCRQCRRLAQQLHVIEESVKLRAQQPAELSPAARQRIAQAISEASDRK